MCRVLRQRAPKQLVLDRGCGHLDTLALQDLSEVQNSPPASTYLFLLRQCRQERSLDRANQIRAHLAHEQIPLTGLLGDYLVLTLASCGAIDDARHVSSTLPCRSVYSWTAIITALVDAGRPINALQVYQEMLDDRIQPDKYTFVSLLKACGCIQDIASGKKFHAQAAESGIANDGFVGNTLISMYGKCGEVVEAETLFLAMPMRSVTSWNSMISAYLDNGQGVLALQLYAHMHAQGESYNQTTYILAVQSCVKIVEMIISGQSSVFPTLYIGRAVHADLRRKGLASQIFIASTLVSFYGKIKSVSEAENAFLFLSHHDVISWNVIIAAYVEQGQGQNSLQLYVWMQRNGISPDRISIMGAIQACGLLSENDGSSHTKEDGAELVPLQIVQALHADAEIMGITGDDFVTNATLSMYGKCGAIQEAEQMFSGVFYCDPVVWNAMLSGYVEQGEGEKALKLYSQMLHDGVPPEQLTFVIVIQACAIIAEVDSSLLDGGRSLKVRPLHIGKSLHADARKEGFELDAQVGCTLVSMYGERGAINEAEHIFSMLLSCDVVAWNVMLSLYVEKGDGYKALQLFKHLQEEDVSLDQMTLMAAIQACILITDMGNSLREASFVIGKLLHVEACKRGFLLYDYVKNTLINMYVKCGAFLEAEHVFRDMCIRSVVAWNTLISAYVEQSHGERAMQLYAEMQTKGICPDQLTCIIALQACISLAENKAVLDVNSTEIEALDIGHSLYSDALKKGFTSDVFITNTVVSMYGKCGDSVQAKYVFDMMSGRTVVSWNVMLAAYVENGQGEKAMELYREMKKHDLILDHKTPICILQACGLVGSLELCKRTHFDIVSGGYDHHASLNAPLIHAYGRCASMDEAQVCFSQIGKPDITSWNACIAGYMGDRNHVDNLWVYEELKFTGLKPDEVTFTSMLSTCSHSGLLAESLEYMESIGRDYGLTLNLMHYGSMLDLFGRAQDFQSLENLLKKMPVHTELGVWLCLLSASCTRGNMDLAKLAFDRAKALEPDRSALYVLMSNIFVNPFRFEESEDGSVFPVDNSWPTFIRCAS